MVSVCAIRCEPVTGITLSSSAALVRYGLPKTVQSCSASTTRAFPAWAYASVAFATRSLYVAKKLPGEICSNVAPPPQPEQCPCCYPYGVDELRLQTTDGWLLRISPQGLERTRSYKRRPTPENLPLSEIQSVFITEVAQVTGMGRWGRGEYASTQRFQLAIHTVHGVYNFNVQGVPKSYLVDFFRTFGVHVWA